MSARPVITKDNKTAILVGYEGFVGTNVLDLLVKTETYEKIVVLLQKPAKLDHPKIEWNIAPMSKMNMKQWEADDFFLCYDASFFNAGGKYAIPKENYKYIPKMVLHAYQNGVSQLILLSSKNADPDGLLFTHRIRGLIELSVRRMGYWGTHIFKPSLLIGESAGPQWGQKLADQVGNKIDGFTGGWLRKNKPIEASVVARAMIEAAQKLEKGTYTYSSAWLQDYASANRRTDLSKK